MEGQEGVRKKNRAGERHDRDLVGQGDGFHGARTVSFLLRYGIGASANLAGNPLLELLISPGGLPKILAQAVSLVLATPVNFLGNKMWSFRL